MYMAIRASHLHVLWRAHSPGQGNHDSPKIQLQLPQRCQYCLTRYLHPPSRIQPDWIMVEARLLRKAMQYLAAKVGLPVLLLPIAAEQGR